MGHTAETGRISDGSAPSEIPDWRKRHTQSSPISQEQAQIASLEAAFNHKPKNGDAKIGGPAVLSEAEVNRIRSEGDGDSSQKPRETTWIDDVRYQ